jgi:hypothetical protein
VVLFTFTIYTKKKKMSGVFSLESVYEDNDKFNPALPPIFDDYDEEVVAVIVKEPCYSFDSGHGFEGLAKPIEHTFSANEFQIWQDQYLVGFQAQRRATTKDRLVHGGRWGGWHKGFLKFKGRNKMQSGVKWCSCLYSELLLVFVFDPGGMRLHELRAIPSQGGGNDASTDEWLRGLGSTTYQLGVRDGRGLMDGFQRVEMG